jgi:hypothetical protein
VSDQPALRASDEDREETAAEIREHYASGRLSSDELSQRLELAYRAQTVGELQLLRADLPKLPAGPESSRAELAARRSELGRHLVQQTGAALTPFLVCVAIWLLSGANGSFWPVWLLLVALIPLMRNGWRLYGPAPDLDRVEKDLAHRRRDRRRE